MAARRQIQPALEVRVVQAPGMMQHGQFPAGHHPADALPLQDLLENKIASQAGEIELFVGENRRLATSHLLLREDLIVSQQEVQRLKAHIRSIQTESDIQIRVLLDKMAKMEADIRAGESVKNDFKQAHMEAQSLVKARQELTSQIQQASQELQEVRVDVKSLPDLRTELDNSRHELKRIRATFEYEKSLNREKVEQLQAMEQNLIAMARVVEKLRAEVLNADKRLNALRGYDGGYMSPDPPYAAPVQVGSSFVDSYGRPVFQIANGSSGDGSAPCGSGSGTAGGAAVPSSAGGVAVLGGPYDPTVSRGQQS